MTVKSRLEKWLLTAPPARAWLEMAAAGALLLAVVVLTAPRLSAGSQQNSVFVVILSAVSLFGLRMRRFKPPWHRQLGLEITLGVGLALIMAGGLVWLAGQLIAYTLADPSDAGLMAIVTTVLGFRAGYGSETVLPASIMFSVLFSSTIAYFTMRFGTALLAFWVRLQRRHLIWAIANSHLLLVLVGVLLMAAIFTLNSLQYIISQQPEEVLLPLALLVDLVPITIVFAVFAAMILVVVMPPAIVISYFAARRTTRRLKALTDTATALRTGHYDVRVPVTGEDEVARLQEDFNAMAADLQRTMNELEAERDAVMSLLNARRELIASVSHELRTPVAILRGHQETLLDGSTTPSPDELRHAIEIMAQTTLNLQHLIDDLFTLSRAEVNQLEIERRQVAVEAVARRCAESAGPSIWAAGRVELALDIAPNLPAALVDETRLEQIIYNLVRNSARHTPPGGIIAIRVFADTTCIVLQVSDTGEGIAPEDLPHIWERFYRADSARALDSGGSGLGLALVKELTEAMGGSVSAESQLGQGSCFTIRLPCDSA